MDTTRICALLEPFLEEPPSPDVATLISIYIDLLLRWNTRINLTAIRNEEEIVTRHFGESLFLARHLFPDRHSPELSQFSVVDIGSGAGFPGIPLKIWAPTIRLTLIESNHKKAAFLREISRALTLMDVNVITERAESFAARPAASRTNVVTLRAVESFESIVGIGASIVAPAGRLALLIGESQTEHLLPIPGFTWNHPLAIPMSKSRVLAIGVRHGSGK